MNRDERSAADELDRLLSSLQGGRAFEPSRYLDKQDAQLAAKLVLLANTMRLDSAAAARIEAQLKQTRPWEWRPGRGRWQAVLNGLAGLLRAPARRPMGVAVLTLVLTVASFALFSRLSVPAAMPVPTLTANPLPPARPRTIGEYGPAILSFLNDASGNPSALKSLLTAWGALKPVAPITATWEATGDLLTADVDGNSEDDLLLALPNPDSPAGDGTFMLFLKQSGTYHLAQETAIQSRPRILYAQDVLGDGRVTVVRSTAQCGAHICTVDVDVLRWANNQWRSLTAAKAQMDYPEVTLVDGAQGAKDLVLHGGVNPTAGAGPQRGSTAIYRWNGATFALAETRQDASAFLYFKVVDANLLMQQRNYGAAAALYQEAAGNNQLQTWEGHVGAQERADLQAFSRFRAMVAYSLLGDVTKAQVWRDYVLNQQANHIYARVTFIFWQSYAPNKSVAVGCRAVTAFADSNAAVAGVLNNFGFANPAFNSADVCPFN